MDQLFLHYYIFRYIHSLHNVIRHNNYAEITILNPSLIITLLSTLFKSAIKHRKQRRPKDFKVLKSIDRAAQNNCHMFLALISPLMLILLLISLSCQVCYIPLMASLTISKTMPHKTIWTGTSLVAEGDGFWCDKNKSQGQSLSLFKSIRFLQR